MYPLNTVERMMNYTVDDDKALEQARSEIFRHLLPIIVCMIVFGAAGIVGNILTFIFYAFKTKRATPVLLIACLAAVDLTVCVMFVPNIAEMWVNVKYTQGGLCIFAHFAGLWAVACSGLILWVVAIDRHRKICSPFGKQLTLVTTKYAIIGIVVFGFLLSVRNFANFDTVGVDVKLHTDQNSTVKGHYCTTRDDPDYIASVTVFTVIDFLLVLMVWITLLIVYSHIIYTLFKLKSARKRMSTKHKDREVEISTLSHETEYSDSTNVSREAHTSEVEEHSSDRTEGKGVHQADRNVTTLKRSDNKSILKKVFRLRPSLKTAISLNDERKVKFNESPVQKNQKDKEFTNVERADSDVKTPENQSEQGELSLSHVSDSLQDSGHSPSDEQSHSKRRTWGRKKHRKYNSAKSARERKLTLKMLTVSIVFVICFTPYFVVKIWMREVLKSGEEYELSLLSQIALRLPYMNSVFNPVVYCVFNPHFRLYIKEIVYSFAAKCFSKSRHVFRL